MLEPLIAFGVLAAVSMANTTIKTLLTRGHGESTKVAVVHKEALITVPPATMKKYGNTSELPYQWFTEVWKLVSNGKLIPSDAIVQELFTARGKGREAQKAFYIKYGGVDDAQ